MTTFKPKMFKSQNGCCICRAKSSRLAEKISWGENNNYFSPFFAAPALQQVRGTPRVSRGVSRWRRRGGAISVTPASSLSRGGTSCHPPRPRTGLTLLTPGRVLAWRLCRDQRRKRRRWSAWSTNTSISGKEGARSLQCQWRSADLGVTPREATDQSRPASRTRPAPAPALAAAPAPAPAPPLRPSTQISWTRSTGEGKPWWSLIIQTVGSRRQQPGGEGL